MGFIQPHRNDIEIDFLISNNSKLKHKIYTNLTRRVKNTRLRKNRHIRKTKY